MLTHGIEKTYAACSTIHPSRCPNNLIFVVCRSVILCGLSDGLVIQSGKSVCKNQQVVGVLEQIRDIRCYSTFSQNFKSIDYTQHTKQSASRQKSHQKLEIYSHPFTHGRGVFNQPIGSFVLETMQRACTALTMMIFSSGWSWLLVASIVEFKTDRKRN